MSTIMIKSIFLNFEEVYMKFFQSMIIVLLIFISGLFAQSGEKITIALLDLDPQGGVNKQESGVLTSRLRSKLVSTKEFIVLDRGKMDAILNEQGFQVSGCTSAECAIEIGKLLNVQRMVAGTIGKIGSLYTIDVVFIDIETSEIVKSITRDYQGEIEELIKFMGSIANELAGKNVDEPVASPVIAKAAAFGSVEITSIPNQATIYIDDIKVGLSPYRLDELKTGIHTLKLSKSGYIDNEQSFEVSANKRSKLSVTLERLNVLTIESDPKDAAFYINDELKGTTPVTMELRTGKYTLKIAKNGYANWEEERQISADYSPTISLLKMYKVNFMSVPSKAEVFMSNQYIGSTPVLGEFPEGHYNIRIHLENYQDYEDLIKLRKDMNIQAKLKYTKEYRKQLRVAGKGGGSKKWFWIGSATAIIGGGLYYYLNMQDESPDTGFPIPVGRP